MPSFCRHNRLTQNCTICARELNLEVRPLVSSSQPKSSQAHSTSPDGRTPAAPHGRTPAMGGGAARPPGPAERPTRRGRRSAAGDGHLRVRRLARGQADGFQSPLVPGLHSSQDAQRLASELAYSAGRLARMRSVAAGGASASDPASWREIAATGGDLSTRTELAVRVVFEGPRGVGGPQALAVAQSAYAGWVQRAGSPQAAFTGDPGWSPQRRFERVFERAQFGGVGRDARFELLTLLGHLGLYELEAPRLFLAGENEVTWAAKRVFGIADQLLLERRAAELADACGLELAVLDLALQHWGTGVRLAPDVSTDSDADADVLRRSADALGL